MNVFNFTIEGVARTIVASWRSILWWLVLAAVVQAPTLYVIASGLHHQISEDLALAAIVIAGHVALWLIAQAVVSAAMLAHLRGQRASLSDLLGMALRLPASLIRLILVYSLINGLLVFIPHSLGFWLDICFDLVCYGLVYPFLAVIVPVAINERAGALEALRRSVFLTRNERGVTLFSLYLASYSLRWPVIILLALWAGKDGTREAFDDRVVFIQLATRWIGPVILGVVNTTLYRALRLAEEGIDILGAPRVPEARIHKPG